MGCCENREEGVVLTLHVVPRSSRTAFAGRHGDALKVRLQAPPVDGKANKALLRFLARTFDIPARDATLLSGQTSRTKRVLLKGVTRQTVAARLPS